MGYAMTDMQYQGVYNMLSFSLASMMATTVFLWFRSFAVKDQYKSAVLISGLVTFIAAYHYIRIFNSWVEAYHYSVGKVDPALTGVPFNDAYRYMDWLLTVPLLLIEILLVCKLSDAEYSAKAWNLGLGSALMIVSDRQKQDPDCAVGDSRQLVHISSCVLVPHAWHQCCSGSCQHSAWLLCI